jgi:hypothetical protein
MAVPAIPSHSVLRRISIPVLPHVLLLRTQLHPITGFSKSGIAIHF